MDIQYKIIGGDGREYGPVSLEELKAWVRDGRVSGSTQVSRSDVGSWTAAASYVELQPVLPLTVAGGSDQLRPAGFWARLGAYLIDAIILGIVGALVWIPVAAAFHWANPTPPSMNPTPEEMKAFFFSYFEYVQRSMLVNLPISCAYFVLMTGSIGATVGKLAIGAKILRLDNSPIGYGVAFLRWLGTQLSTMICFIGFLFIAFRQDKRGMHDLLVGTKVVYKR